MAVGLSVVFELIRESRSTNPSLCSRALHALLDTLQGQPPEGLASEPSVIIDSLFDLLMELNCSVQHSNTASMSSNDVNNVNPSNVTARADESVMNSMMQSFACSCLLSLVVARGDTGKVLSAISGILTTPKAVKFPLVPGEALASSDVKCDGTSSNTNDDIEVPNILIAAQKAVQMVLLDHKPSDQQQQKPQQLNQQQQHQHLQQQQQGQGQGTLMTPTWITHGFPKSSACDSFRIRDFSKSKKVKSVDVMNSSITFDGKYLFILSGNVIYKVGSGYSGTIRGQVVLTKKIPLTNSTTSIATGSNGNSHHLIRYSHHVQSKQHSSQQKSYSVDGHTMNAQQAQHSPGWIGWIKGYLYLQTGSWQSNQLLKLDTSTLKDVAIVTLATVPSGPVVACTDGECLVTISSTKDESFVMRSYKPSTLSPQQSLNSTLMSQTPTYLMLVSNELNLKLAHQCLVLVGACPSLTNNQTSTTQLPSTITSNASEAYVVQLSHLNTKAAILGNETNKVPTCQDDNECNFNFKHVSFINDPIDIVSGKDFAILLTSNGKVYFTGRSQSLGLKHLPIISTPINSCATSNPVTKPIGDWYELPISSKSSPRIRQVAVGHEGSHLLLVTDDGTVYFAGLAEKGEDGDHNKSCRRMPKSSKPKKLSRMSGKSVIYAACNHGTSAIVTRKGDLYMFGKDISHCDKSTGQVICPNDSSFTDLTQVALGKAHALVLNAKGQVFSFGFNNKGQCGREIVKPSDGNKIGVSPLAAGHASNSVKGAGKSMGDTCVDVDTSEDISIEPMATCSSGNHRWVKDKCMICTACNYCTGYGSNCVTRSRPGRIPPPGQECGCGTGDSGCGDCGICQTCDNFSKEIFDRSDRKHAEQLRDPTAYAVNELILKLRQSMANPCPSQNAAFHGSLTRSAIKNTQDALRSAFRYADQAADEILTQATGQLAYTGQITDETGTGSDSEATKLTSLPPARVNINGKAIQVACGLHHSVVLLDSGDVYTFGYNHAGQLGLGDFSSRDKPVKVHLPTKVSAIAAGSNHTVFLTVNGEVYTCGSNSKGQLGRPTTATGASVGEDSCSSTPMPMAKIGLQFGRRATLVQARGESTFIKMDESLINPLELSSIKAMANGHLVVISPPPSGVNGNASDEGERQFTSLVINRSNGSCRTFNEPDQVNLSNFDCCCLDSCYGIMWSFESETSTVSRFSLLASQSKYLANFSNSTPFFKLPSIISPEIALPTKPDSKVSKANAALNLLSILHTLAKSGELCDSNSVEESSTNVKAKDDCLVVNRFESNGGGWAYSGHSIEAIRFSADSDIQVVGLSLFGGRGEYIAKIRLYDLGPDGGDVESDGELLTETDEVPYECSARAKHPILFDEPITISANRWYVAWARIHGPSSDCGSAGLPIVAGDEQVTFTFKASKKSNNGTDVNAGQIPQILYKLLPQIIPSVPSTSGLGHGKNVLGEDLSHQLVDETICKLSRSFAMTVSVDTFTSLLKLLRWSWTSFRSIMDGMSSMPVNAIPAVMANAKQLTFVSCVSLQLLKTYTNITFPPPMAPEFNGRVSGTISTGSNSNNTPSSASATASSSGSNAAASQTKLPPSQIPDDSLAKIAEAIGDVRSLIKSILTDDLFKDVTVSFDGTSTSTASFLSSVNFPSSATVDDLIDWRNDLECMAKQILLDTKTVFASCYHAYYPCSSLRWHSLTEILINHGIELFEANGHNLQHLLTVILTSLCDSNIPYIRYTFPLEQSIDSPSATSPVEDLTSPSEPTTSAAICNKAHQLAPWPSKDIGVKCDLLIQKLLEKTNQESNLGNGRKYILRDVLNKLLSILSQPIEAAIKYSSKMDSQMEEWTSIIESTQLCKELVESTCNLVTCLVYELTAQSLRSNYTSLAPYSTLLVTPSRFTRIPPNVSWRTSGGSSEAICFQVDRSGIVIVGATVFCGGSGKWHYTLELMEYQSDLPNTNERLMVDRSPYSDLLWKTIASVKGSYGLSDSKAGEMTAEIHFEKPIPIKPNVKYTLRLGNLGNKTYNGDAGVTTIQGPDGTVFTFSDSVHSCNGTNHLRGQLPSILYYSSAPNVVKKSASSSNVAAVEKTKKSKESKSRLESNAASEECKILFDPVQARKNLLVIFDAIIELTKFLLSQVEPINDDTLTEYVSSSSLVTMLLPCVLASLHSIIYTDPKSSIFVASGIKKLLPHVASLNKFLDRFEHRSRSRSRSKSLPQQQLPSPQGLSVGSLVTTSKYHTVVESDHPYKAATISTYNVTFPLGVKWMTVEFDPRCGTVQPEDSLHILAPVKCRTELQKSIAAIPSMSIVSPPRSNDYISPKSEYLPVAKQLSGPPIGRSANSNWPSKAIILPGNELIFSLETATDYIHDEQGCYFGFRVQVIGYELPFHQNGLANLEQELSLLASFCMASLLSPVLQLTSSEPLTMQLADTSSALSKKGPSGDEKSDESNNLATFKAHAYLLSKGLNFAHMPTVMEALDDQLPYNPVKPFLADFINATPGTSGGRLAHWLLPESYVDPANCIAQVVPLSGDTLQVAWPIQVIVKIRDQYSQPITCPDLKVEVTQPYHLHSNAGPNVDFGPRGPPQRLGRQTNENLTLESIGKVSLDVPYQVTCDDKMRYHAITFMSAYEEYSFEELRFMTPVKKRPVELLTIRDNKDGTYVAYWTPNLPGMYNVSVKIDGQLLSSVQSIMVTGPPAGSSSGSKQKMIDGLNLDEESKVLLNSQSEVKLTTGKMRQCVTEKSSGLRIRALPSLQSEQIGLVTLGDVITFTDEVHNADGIWLRLSPESIVKYCYEHLNVPVNISEAWIMQYNSHYGKSYLVPVVEFASDPEYATSDGVNDSTSISSILHHTVNDSSDISLLDDASRHMLMQEQRDPTQSSTHHSHPRRHKHHHQHHKHHQHKQQVSSVVDGEGTIKRSFESINGSFDTASDCKTSAPPVRSHRSRKSRETYMINDWTSCPVEFEVIELHLPLYLAPSKASPVLTTLTIGDRIWVSCRSANVEGVWLKLDNESTAKYFELLYDVANFVDLTHTEFWVLSSTVDGGREYLLPVNATASSDIEYGHKLSPKLSIRSSSSSPGKSNRKRKSSSSSSSSCSLNDAAAYAVSNVPPGHSSGDSIAASTVTCPSSSALVHTLPSGAKVVMKNDGTCTGEIYHSHESNSLMSSNVQGSMNISTIDRQQQDVSTDSGAGTATGTSCDGAYGTINTAAAAAAAVESTGKTQPTTTASVMTLSDISSISTTTATTASSKTLASIDLLCTGKGETSQVSSSDVMAQSSVSLPNAELPASPSNSKVAAYRKLLSDSLRGSFVSATAKMPDLPSLKVSVRERVQSLSSRESSPSKTPPMTPPSTRRSRDKIRSLSESSNSSSVQLKSTIGSNNKSLDVPLTVTDGQVGQVKTSPGDFHHHSTSTSSVTDATNTTAKSNDLRPLGKFKRKLLVTSGSHISFFGFFTLLPLAVAPFPVVSRQVEERVLEPLIFTRVCNWREVISFLPFSFTSFLLSLCLFFSLFSSSFELHFREYTFAIFTDKSLRRIFGNSLCLFLFPSSLFQRLLCDFDIYFESHLPILPVPLSLASQRPLLLHLLLLLLVLLPLFPLSLSLSLFFSLPRITSLYISPETFSFFFFSSFHFDS